MTNEVPNKPNKFFKKKDTTEKKGFLGKLGDALSTRDEKAAVEKAQAEAAAAKAEAARQADLAKAAQAKAAAATKQKMEDDRHRLDAAQAATVKAAQAAAQAAATPKLIKTHEVKGYDETLSGLALHFYGNATRPYWEVIWNANKDVLGDDPNHLKVGMKLKIPELPAEMKKK